MKITSRKDVKIGMLVLIRDEDTGEEIRGYITEIITKNNSNKGILVKIKSGKTGRVIGIPDKEDLKSEQMRFLNKFLYLKQIYSIWDNQNKRFIVLKSNNKNTALLFTSKEEAFSFIKERKLSEKYKKLTVNQLNRKKLIVDNFKTLDVECFIINVSLKIDKDKLLDKEVHFNKLLNM